MSQKRVLFPVMAALLFALVSTAFPVSKEIYFVETPALSPAGKEVVFSYEDDLWIVSARGGTAYRLTAMEGREIQPRFSPDARWLAFSGSQFGNFDVYVMPAAGGEIRRLTFHDSDDFVDSWCWDSKYIYFNSNRYNDFTEYRVGVAGETPQRIFENYFNIVHGLVEHPQSGAYYFTDSWESYRFGERKRYKGEFNPDIKSYDPKTKEYKVHTTYPGKDLWPCIDNKGNIYFASVQANDEYNLFTFKDGGVVQLTNFQTSLRCPQVSANGEFIVFEKDYRLFIYDVAKRKTEKIEISLFKNDLLSIHQDFNVKGMITHFDISPDSKKIAFVCRGELFVSDIGGKFINKVATSPQGRVMEVNWLSDSKTLVFNQTVKGWLNLFKIRVDKPGQEGQLTFDEANNRSIALNGDRSQAVYLSGTRHVKVMDLKSFTSRGIVEDEIWGYYNSQPYFSPDDRYVVFTAYRNFEEDIFIHHLETAETRNLTDSGITEADPFWSPDGKYLFFSGDRYSPRFPREGDNSRIYRLALEKYDKEYRFREFEKLFQEKEKKDKKDKDLKQTPHVTFDYDNLVERWEQVSPEKGKQYQPYVTGKDGEYTVLYISDHDGEQENVWKTTIKPFEPIKTEKIKGAQTDDLILSYVKDKFFILVNGAIHKLDLKGNSIKPISMDYTFRRNLADEFRQMFDEVWANLQENYYDETFHGMNWEKIKEYYKQFLPHIRSRSNLRQLIDDMLGELNSSHLGFRSRGKEEETFHSTNTMNLGIIFTDDQPYRVKYIVKGSAADKKDINIIPGDVLTAANDQRVDNRYNRESYFTTPSLDKEIKLTFKRNNQVFHVWIHPENTRNFKKHLYDEWIQDNQYYVDKKSNQRIAYIHMKNMGEGELKRFLLEMTTEWYKRDGLILDLRYNTGGNVHDAVLDFLSRRPYTRWKYRGGKFAPQPPFAPSAKPIMLLINEQSLSDAEMTAAGFKALKLGTVIGTETYRWLIFTSGKGLVDGSYYRLPSWGCFTLEGRDIEWDGVKPDIYVKTTFKDRLERKDPQLDTAIDEVLKQLAEK